MKVSINAFNALVIDIIKAARKAKSIKQSEIAAALCMTECNYNKIEKHHKPLNMVQVVIISNILGISARKLVSLAEAMQEPGFLSMPIEEQIVKLHVTGSHNLLDDFRDENLVVILNLLRPSPHTPGTEEGPVSYGARENTGGQMASEGLSSC
jgi:transcriptional regulator with XRE-family HTH domain